MKSVTIKIGDYDLKTLDKIFENEQDFKPTDPRDELLIAIMKQFLCKAAARLRWRPRSAR